MNRLSWHRVSFLTICGIAIMFAAAIQPACYDIPRPGEGGGHDSIAIAMPFEAGYTSQCMQGAGGDYSHSYTSTLYDIDLDTPNGQDDLVFAPASGTAYVHDSNRTTGFGVHINLDLGDGTYIVLGHLDDVFIEDGEGVAKGQILGFEGTTGASTGDHVHIGRHTWDASQDATYGTSIEGLSLSATDLSGGSGEYSTGDMVCDLSSGHRYESDLETALWHPDGSLVMTPYAATVYLVEDGKLRAFDNEDTFWSRNYSFENVSLISSSELDCFELGDDIDSTSSVSAVVDDDTAWLLIGGASASDRVRYQVPSSGWQAVLQSWGIVATTIEELPSEADLDVLGDYPVASSKAVFRDGSLLTESGDSAVYVIVDGVAEPIIDWSTYLLLDFWSRAIIEVDPGVISAVQGRVGNCSIGSYCLSWDNVVTCGGPDDDAWESGESGTGGGTNSTEDEEEAGTSSEDESPDEHGEGALIVLWNGPGSRSDYMSMWGEYTDWTGYSHGWREYAWGTSIDEVETIFAEAQSGDTFRFSVEFEQNGSTSSLCLWPYPPGTVQGATTVTFSGTHVPAYAVLNRESNGCDLLVTVP